MRGLERRLVSLSFLFDARYFVPAVDGELGCSWISPFHRLRICRAARLLFALKIGLIPKVRLAPVARFFTFPPRGPFQFLEQNEFFFSDPAFFPFSLPCSLSLGHKFCLRPVSYSLVKEVFLSSLFQTRLSGKRAGPFDLFVFPIATSSDVFSSFLFFLSQTRCCLFTSFQSIGDPPSPSSVSFFLLFIKERLVQLFYSLLASRGS